MKNVVTLLIGALIGAALVYFFHTKTTTMNDQQTEPNGIIKPAEIKALDVAFNSRHQLISDSIVKRPDNRSSWYSLKDMRDYLNYAESQAKDLGYKMDGIRVYLGAHADEGNTVGYTTMFFVPTGNQITAEGNLNPFNMMAPPINPPDIPGGNGLNGGDPGHPPGANYPQ